jgi:hypothetical protein
LNDSTTRCIDLIGCALHSRYDSQSATICKLRVSVFAMDIWDDDDDDNDVLTEVILVIIADDAQKAKEHHVEEQQVLCKIGPPSSGGSRKGKAPNVDRCRVF